MGVRVGWAGRFRSVQLAAGGRELERSTRSVTRDVRWGERRRLRASNAARGSGGDIREPDTWRPIAQCATA